MALVFGLALGLAGCSPAGSPEPVSEAPAPIDPGLVAIRLEAVDVYGPVPRQPGITVYRDGRVLWPAVESGVGAFPTVQAMTERRIPEDEVVRLIQAGLDAGLRQRPDLGRPSVQVVDAGTPRFTLRTDDGRRTTFDWDGQPATAVTPVQHEAREKIEGFRAQLLELTTRPGGQQRFAPSRMAVVSGSYELLQGSRDERPLDWPGPPLPGPSAPGFSGEKCLIVEGMELGQVLQEAQRASAVTPWVYDGRRWSVILHPLLPDQRTCADLSWR